MIAEMSPRTTPWISASTKPEIRPRTRPLTRIAPLTRWGATGAAGSFTWNEVRSTIRSPSTRIWGRTKRTRNMEISVPRLRH